MLILLKYQRFRSHTLHLSRLRFNLSRQLIQLPCQIPITAIPLQLVDCNRHQLHFPLKFLLVISQYLQTFFITVDSRILDIYGFYLFLLYFYRLYDLFDLTPC